MSGAVVIVHAGALGDSVLLWPLLRALIRAGRTAWFIAADSHARLAAKWVGADAEGPRAVGLRVEPVGAESGWPAALWRGPQGTADLLGAAGGARVLRARHAVEHVLSFVADEQTTAGAAWIEAARAVFPHAVVTPVGPPGSASRSAVWAAFDAERLGRVATVRSAGGPVIGHIGAGAAAKRWPIERWVELISRVRAGDPRAARPARAARVIFGPVEAETLSPGEHAALARVLQPGDGAIDRLDTLAEVVAGASVFVGHDSGPAHLAGQLGVPTVALFGPTDPALWAPIGPAVRVVAPPAPAGMDWLTAERALAEVHAATTLG